MKQVLEIGDLSVQTGDRLIQLIRETQMMLHDVDFPHDVNERAYPDRFTDLMSYCGKVVSLRAIAPAGRIAKSVRPVGNDVFYHQYYTPNAVGVMTPTWLQLGKIELKAEEHGWIFKREVEYLTDEVVSPVTFEPLFVAEVFEPK